MIFSFGLVLEKKGGKVIPESSRLELLEKTSANNFPYQMEKTTPKDHCRKEGQQNYLC